MLELAGGTRFDPVRRRRVRRLAARLRPSLLPAAVVVAALLLAGRDGAPVVATAVPGPVAPPGRVLVAVAPAEPAGLLLAVAGARVDVYAAGGPGDLVPGDVRPAQRVAVAALVVDPSPPVAGEALPGGEDPGLLAAAAPAGAGAVTLAVTDAEAAALAAHPGSRLTLAVRPAPAARDDRSGPGG